MALRFDLALVYMECLGVFVLILVGTFAFVQYGQVPLIGPFVLLSAAVILGVAGQWKRHAAVGRAKKQDDATEQLDLIVSGGVWIAWLVYGVVFRDVAPLVSGVAAQVHGVVVVLLVLLSHARDNIRREAGWSTGLLLVVVALLFIPHPDTVSQSMPPHVLVIKVCVFYALFAGSEAVTKLEFDVRSRAGDAPTRPERVYARQIQIVQSAWVLLSVFSLVPIAIAQMLLLVREARRLNRERWAPTELPTTAATAANGMVTAADPVGGDETRVGVDDEGEEEGRQQQDRTLRFEEKRQRRRRRKQRPSTPHKQQGATINGGAKRGSFQVKLPSQFMTDEFLDGIDIETLARQQKIRQKDS